MKLFFSIIIIAASMQVWAGDSPAYYRASKKNILRILTYNVRNGLGQDNKYDYERVAAVIRAVDPDVVAVQELDSVTIRNNGVDVLSVLSKKTHRHGVYGASIAFQGGKYGIGILSKEKPLSKRFISLPGREEKRGLLIVEFKDYYFACTHLSLTIEDQYEDVKIINRICTGLNKKVFLAGDFNSTEKSDPITEVKKNWIQLSGNQSTFPSDNPIECIDFVFGLRRNDQNYVVVRQKVVDESMASDHRPVFVDVKK